MDLSRIKNLVKRNGDKIILMNGGGEPELVVMSFREYEKLTGGGVENHLPETEFIMSSAEEENRPVRLEEITLDDLPL